MTEVKLDLDDITLQKLNKVKDEEGNYSVAIGKLLDLYEQYCEERDFELLQRRKMTEIWDNKEDEYWENV